MKKLLKLYKMFHRLLSLKSEQRKEMEKRFACTLAKIYDEYFGTKLILDCYERAAHMHGLSNPYEVFMALGIVPGMNITATRADYLFLKTLLEEQFKNPKYPWRTQNETSRQNAEHDRTDLQHPEESETDTMQRN